MPTLPESIRIAHVALQLETGGMEHLLTCIARFSDRARFDLRFVSLTERGELAAEIEACGWPVTALGARPGARPMLVARLARLFAGRVDVVHTHNTKPLLYAGPAAQLAGVRSIIHTRHGQRRGATKVQNVMFRAAARYVDRMVCVSSDAADRCRAEGVDGSVVCTIPGGIDLSRFPFAGPVSKSPAAYVGRLSAEKDVGTLLRAAVTVARADESFRMVIAGDGPCADELAGMARSLDLSNRVQFLGNVADVPSLLRAASMFVLPSLSEGLPITVLEAMASGLPVVATNVGGTSEAVDSSCGLLVPPGDPEALAAAILELRRDQERTRMMGVAGRRRVEQLFDVRNMVSRYESLYEEVCRARSSLAA
jgi:glycosyltransferase involved in cell wall biosynthesis